MKQVKWVASVADENKVKCLTQQGYHPIVARLFAARGIEPSAIEGFITPSPSQFHDPYLMNGMQRAVDRIRDAIRHGEKIVIYGDYDADGATSTSIMVLGLRHLGANVTYYIPSRFSEGYGVNREAIKELAEQGTNLIITVDTGITAYEEVEYANNLHVDIIVTDHHHVPDLIPNAISVINPHQNNETYLFSDLSGAGIALKVIQALRGDFALDLVDLAALGTIADLVPLNGENRVISTLGLRKMATDANPGLLSLMMVAGVPVNSVQAGHVSFQLAPRINAMGRMEHAKKSVELFLSDNSIASLEIANEIDHQNRIRQKTTDEIAEQAIAQVEEHPEWLEHGILICSGQGWHEGVIGIVASRIVERYYRPTLVIGIDEAGNAKGSARSIPGIDLYECLSQATVFSKFGGHPMAAGFSLPAEHIDRLREELWTVVDRDYREHSFIPVVSCDAPVSIADATLDLAELISKMEPFGFGNPTPRLFFKSVFVSSVKKIGKDQSHLKIVLQDTEGRRLDSVYFHSAEEYPYWEKAVKSRKPIHVVGKIEKNKWKDQVQVQLNLDSWKM